MRINTRFTVAVHMLALLALNKNEARPSTSELLAKSVGTNPVVIRQLMQMLKKAGLIVTQNGVPGSRLSRQPEKITLLEIYKAVQKEEESSLFDFHPNPNPACPIGRNIAGALAAPLLEAQTAMEQSLAGHTLKEIADGIAGKISVNKNSSINDKKGTGGKNQMMKKTELYYFSPTGGTKKVGEAFAKATAGEVILHDLGKMMREALKTQETEGSAEAAASEEAVALAEAAASAEPSAFVEPAADTDLVVVAAPVFGGRLPSAAAEYLKTLKGCGKKAVSLVVYGVRAYEDALLELNDILAEDGFQVIASGAFVAQHSIAPAVGQGRPDAEDLKDISAFAEKVLEKADGAGAVTVPGNHPYKDGMKVAATPICLPSCGKCGVCEAVCPTGAIKITEEGVTTELSKCLLCMACKAACPSGSRILPPPMQDAMNQKLGVLKDVRRENETFL